MERTARGAPRCTHMDDGKRAPRNGKTERRNETDKRCLSRGKCRSPGRGASGKSRIPWESALIAIAVAEISDPWGRTAQLKSRTVTAKKQNRNS